jgi:HPt (histidine-containing phosphotransfer) domain-containing protein
MMIEEGSLMEKSESEKILVSLDRDIEDLVPGFLDNRRRDIETIENCLASGDYTTIERLGHAMKGSGGGYGFDDITRFGMLIEELARDKNSAGIMDQVDSLARFLDSVEVVYE